MQIIKKISFLLLPVLFFSCYQNNSKDGYTIAFYNVENLFDTKDDPHINDNDFLPEGRCHWTEEKYQQKLTHIAKVLSGLGDEDGPEVIGLAEIENIKVLKDLVAQASIKNNHYEIIHFDSPDRRGIDVALLYKKNFMKVVFSKTFSINSYDTISLQTRDILFVKAIHKTDTLCILVNHWPSRRGGEEKSEPKRIAMAKFTKHITDSIIRRSANAKLLLMGDFNDEASDNSLHDYLKVSLTVDFTGGENLYDPFYSLAEKGQGSYKYKSKWFMLDQLMMSKALIKGNGLHYLNGTAGVYNPEWMYYKNDTHSGPFKTFQGDKYYGGYSDHFPVFIRLED